MTNLVQEYTDAFTKHYPQSKLEVKPVRVRGGGMGFRIGINGDFGDLTLTEADMRDAIRKFNTWVPPSDGAFA